MLIDKNSLPLVDAKFMNDTHFEDVDLINEIYEIIEDYEQNKTDENFNRLKEVYNNWVNHTIEHFRKEEEEMVRKNFFAYSHHKGEHDRNLNDIKILWKNFETSKNIEVFKNYIEYDLVNWLVNHIKTMDTITARFFNKAISPSE